MANIQELKTAYDELRQKYARTLGLLLDVMDKLDEKPTEVEVEKIVEVAATIDVDLTTPPDIQALEDRLKGRMDGNAGANPAGA